LQKIIVKQSGLIALQFPHFSRGVIDGYRLFDINGGFLCGNRFANYWL